MTLTFLAWISLAVAFASAVVIILDEIRRPQKMAIMNIVWPISALYLSLFAVWAYFRVGRRQTKETKTLGTVDSTSKRHDAPTLTEVAVGTSHCGAGCAIADVITDFAIAITRLALFGSALWTVYVMDFAAAWTLGILFQYFAIKPCGMICPRRAQSGRR